MSGSNQLTRVSIIHALFDLRLHICLVIASALDLITKALSKLDIDLSGLAVQSLDPTSYAPPARGEFLPLLPDPVPIVPQVGADGNFQDAYIYNFNPDSFEVTKEMLEAFSSLEPVDATVSRLW